SEYLKDKHQNITKGDYVCIEVSDTGQGMSEAVRKRIFEPFFTTKEIGKGTGLGLSVVFGVVQSHNGFIDVESEEGKGTSFKIFLPMSSTIIPVKEKKAETYEDISGGHETLLVVEDEEALLTSLQMMLDEKGYKVLTAGDGLTAINIFKEKKNEIDLVVTDFGLPGMTGLEVSRQTKNIKPEQLVILATGYLDPEMKSELQRAGVMHFLFKPYDVVEVLKTVREVIDKK
ncbi:MAG: response regulator, partial [Bacteroidetes bacterium]|nr:response regulator [Bacteroidota bacterium]